jgi:hypothetical protein
MSDTLFPPDIVNYDNTSAPLLSVYNDVNNNSMLSVLSLLINVA